MIINGATVNSAMSAMTEPVLYASPIFIPNLTFSQDYQIGSAGEIVVSKYKGNGATAPKKPGGDFNGTDVANDTIRIPMNNQFLKEKKIRGVASNAVPFNMLADTVINVTEEQREGWEKAGLARLIEGGTTSSNVTVTTASNVKETIIGLRAELAKKKCSPNVCICSVDFYSALLDYAGKEFTMMFTDEVTRSGKVGSYLGMIFVEASYLDGVSKLDYVKEDDTEAQVNTAGVEAIMYQARAFSILELLNVLRAIDTESFVGTKVQSDITAGYKVTNKDCVMIKTTAVTP